MECVLLCSNILLSATPIDSENISNKVLLHTNSYFMYLNSATCFDLTAIFRYSISYKNTQIVVCVVRLFVLFYVLFVCKCILPPRDKPTAVNKYIISYYFIYDIIPYRIVSYHISYQDRYIAWKQEMVPLKMVDCLKHLWK
jgi:hypothetical protein